MAGQAVDFESQWQQLVARAWADDAFKKKLIADPAGVLKENGLIPPAGTQIKVVENSDKAIYLTLPAKPTAAELSQEELHRVAGGWYGSHHGYERCSGYGDYGYGHGWERCGGYGYGHGWERCGGHERCRH